MKRFATSLEELAPGLEQVLADQCVFATAVLETASEVQPVLESAARNYLERSVAAVMGQACGLNLSLLRAMIRACQEGDSLASEVLVRPVTENTANLLYILYGGPGAEGRTREELAAQFLSYRNVTRSKVSRKGFTDYAAFSDRSAPPWAQSISHSAFLQAKESAELAGRATLDRFKGKMQSASWHSRTLEERMRDVLAHAPAAITGELKGLWDSDAADMTLWNTLAHLGPSLFQTDLAAIKQGGLFGPYCGCLHPWDSALVASRMSYLSLLAVELIVGCTPMLEDTYRRRLGEITKGLLPEFQVLQMIRLS